MRTSSKQKTHQICSFPEDDEILLKKAEMEKYNEGEKELLMRVMKEVRYDLERIPPNLRYIDKKKVRAATVKINKIVSLIKTETITETNSVLRAAGNVAAEMVGYKNKEMTGDRQPNWRRRILEKQKVLRKELGQLNRMRRGELQNEGVISKLERKFNIKRKGADVVHEEVRQRLVAVGAKLERYDNRTKQYRQNRLFESNQKRLFNELEGAQRESVIPDAEESRRFWSDIWDQAVTHRESTDWLRKVENELGELTVQDDIHIEIKKVRKQIRKMPNWKSPGSDVVQRYWIRNLSNLHNSTALQLDRYLQENNLPKWMVTGKSLLCIKEIQKGTLVSNFRPITCLPLIWKLLTGFLAEEL